MVARTAVFTVGALLLGNAITMPWPSANTAWLDAPPAATAKQPAPANHREPRPRPSPLRDFG